MLLNFYIWLLKLRLQCVNIIKSHSVVWESVYALVSTPQKPYMQASLSVPVGWCVCWVDFKRTPSSSSSDACTKGPLRRGGLGV